MKTMLEGEFRRYRLTVWLIQRALIVTPLALLSWSLYEFDYRFLCLSIFIGIQNIVAAWVIAQSN